MCGDCGQNTPKDVTNGTLFPQVVAMAATGNLSLIHEMGSIMGVELRANYNIFQASVKRRHETNMKPT